VSFETTAGAIAKGISKKLYEQCVAAKVQYANRVESPLSRCVAAEVEDEEATPGFEVIDLNRPLEGSCRLELIMFADKEGKEVFWHSSAHILG
jgi:threonyl-tRNA synthetase